MKVESLDTKWKEFLFSFSGFGPNFLMVLMGAYYTDAINPVALIDNEYQSIISGVCFIIPAAFPILFAISRVFDGIIDIPFAYITDTLSTKWGRRRPAIAVCALPMLLSFAGCWLPIGGPNNPLLNTIWIFFCVMIFFSSYSMSLIAFYGSLSTTCTDEPQRLRVSGYKSFFDTISYCLVYALVPILLESFKIHIDKFVFLCLPLMLTIIIPLFMIKEGQKYNYPENDGLKPEKIKFGESLKLTFGNKIFKSWLAVNGCTFFGLQMFLVAMNAMIIGGMGFNGIQMAITNTCAFAPVPVMLYLFNKVKAKKGVRFTYQTCLLAFAVSIMSFFFASEFLWGEDNKTLQLIISCIGSVFASWSIGAFFLMPYLAPAQISTVEEKLMGKNHSAMYFAGNAVVSSIIGAISGGLVYENIKMFFIDKASGDILWAANREEAAVAMNATVTNVFNLGTLIVPFVVAATCILGFFLAFRMPKDYTPKLIAREFKKIDPSLDISEFEKEVDSYSEKESGEIIFVQIGLWVLSIFVFGFIWAAFMMKSFKKFLNTKTILPWILSCFVPFAGTIYVVKRNRQLVKLAEEKNIKMSAYTPLVVVFGILIPLLPLNVILLAVTQYNLNKLYKAQ